MRVSASLVSRCPVSTEATGRRRRLILGLLIATACSRSSQDVYSYPGCDGAGTAYCPRDLVFVCALNAIERKHGGCSSDADCRLLPLGNCFGHLSSCPPAAINAASEQAFREEAEVEVARYCDGARCGGSGSCAFSYRDGGVSCQSGRCVAVPDA